MTYLLLTSQFVLAGVFAWSAVGKMRAYRAFVGSLAEFGVPAGARQLVAAVVLACEVAVVPLTLVPAVAAAGLALGAVLLFGFAAVIGATVRRGRRPRCRCFGAAGSPLRGAHIVRNIVLAVLAATGAAAAGATGSTSAFPVAAYLVAGTLGVVVLAAVVGFDDLLEVIAPSSPQAGPTFTVR